MHETARRSTRLPVLAALLAAAGCASAPVAMSPAPRDDAAAASVLALRLDSLRREARIPGMAVALLRDTSVLLLRGFGVADVERGTEVTPETPFDIASVAKPLSAVVALRLVERGRLELERPMQSFAGFAEFCADVRGEGGVFFGDYACQEPGLTLRHVLSMTANGAAGTRFFYNPVSYSWASRPIAQSAGAPFSDLVAEHVFRPAGMTRSARRHRRLPLRPDLATALARPHRVDSAGTVSPAPPPPPQGDGAAGGVVSTAADLARFDVALSRGALLSPESVRRMWTPGRAADGAPLAYGLGWYVQEHAGRRLVWHGGWWPQAYSALYLKLPDEGLTMIVLANSEGIWWGNPLDAATVERSPFARALLEAFPSASTASMSTSPSTPRGR